jgi:ABC-type glycerol-3-phosphate transport system substrate-binding protein
LVVTAEIPASSGDESLMRRLPKPVIVAIAVAAAAATIAACSSSSGTSAGSSASWNNATADPLKGVWVSAITAFHTGHLNVTIQNVPHQNEFLCHLP